MKTTFKLEKKEINEYEEMYHVTFYDYRGDKITRKMDEPTARDFITQFDKLVNPYEKV